MPIEPLIAPTDTLKQVLEKLVDGHGARAVAEELVEVFHDRADYVHRHPHPSNADTMWRVWRRIACKLGNAVHWQNLAWPS